MCVPQWESNPMKPFLSATLCSALTFWPASFPAATACLAEGLHFSVPVCVCVCAYKCAHSPPTHLGSGVIPGNPPSESV